MFLKVQLKRYVELKLHKSYIVCHQHKLEVEDLLAPEYVFVTRYHGDRNHRNRQSDFQRSLNVCSCFSFVCMYGK